MRSATTGYQTPRPPHKISSRPCTSSRIEQQSPKLWRPVGRAIWAACKPNQVDGRDKPHAMKVNGNGKQDLTKFPVSAATCLPQRSECDLRHIGHHQSQFTTRRMGASPPVPRPVGPALVPPLRGALFCVFGRVAQMGIRAPEKRSDLPRSRRLFTPGSAEATPGKALRFQLRHAGPGLDPGLGPCIHGRCLAE